MNHESFSRNITLSYLLSLSLSLSLLLKKEEEKKGSYENFSLFKRGRRSEIACAPSSQTWSVEQLYIFCFLPVSPPPLFDVNASISLPLFSRLLARKEIKFQPPPLHALCVPAALFFGQETRDETGNERSKTHCCAIPHPFFVTRVLSRTSIALGVRLFHAFPPLPAKKRNRWSFQCLFCPVLFVVRYKIFANLFSTLRSQSSV